MAEETFEVQRIYTNYYKWYDQNKHKVIFVWHDASNEVHVVGNTYPVRHLLKQSGFKWKNGMWVLKLPEPDKSDPRILLDSEAHTRAMRAIFAQWYQSFENTEAEIRKTASTVWIAWAGTGLVVIINPEKVR